MPEPWLRGTLTEVTAVARGALHALELAREDLDKWCGGLTDEEVNARPAGLPPVAFHLRHIARSLDRLLTYAEGGALTEAQVAALRSEFEPEATSSKLFEELHTALAQSAERIEALANRNLDEAREVGTKRLPATLGGLLVHVADHTQRHTGQAITTAKILAAERQRGMG